MAQSVSFIRNAFFAAHMRDIAAWLGSCRERPAVHRVDDGGGGGGPRGWQEQDVGHQVAAGSAGALRPRTGMQDRGQSPDQAER